MAFCCAVCGYDLRASMKGDEAICPECGRRYTGRDLAVLMAEPDRSGEPANHSPHECRIPGRLLLVLFVLLVLGFLWLLNWWFAAR